MITAIVIEDERKSRDLLCAMLSNYCEGVEVLGNASNVEEAYDLIQKTSPQLVFLDIQLAGKTGFDLLDAVPDRRFEVVFTTAYEKYAVKAVKYSGIDYLLKPIGLDELREAIKRAGEKIAKNFPSTAPSADTPENEAPTNDRLVVPSNQGYLMLEIIKIMYFKAEGAYTRIFMDDGKNILVSNAIGFYESRLAFPSFIRIHRSWLVNQNFIGEYVRGRGGFVLLKNGEHLNVSARKKPDLLQALGL